MPYWRRVASSLAVPETITGKLYRWLLQPSARIPEPDQRRRAALLSALLLAVWVLSLPTQGLYVVMEAGPRGLLRPDNLAIELGLPALYALSRTHRTRLTAYLFITLLVAVNFVLAAGNPQAAETGLLDYLIVPLLLASFFMDLTGLAALAVGLVAALLVLAALVPSLELDAMLSGPVSFIIVAAAMLMVTTRYRDLLERDRHEQLIEKEQRSQREAMRAQALLHVAERLNAQFNLQALVQALAEEARLALNTPVVVSLLDDRREMLTAVGVSGLPAEDVDRLPTLPRQSLDRLLRLPTGVASLAEIAEGPQGEPTGGLNAMAMRSAAVAAISYENELLGIITAGSLQEPREFTTEERRLLRGIAHQGAQSIVNTRLFKDAHRRLENLQALRAIDIAISTSHDLARNLAVLLEQVTRQLGVDAAVFLLLDHSTRQLQFAASRGFRSNALQFTRLQVGEGLAGYAAQERRLLYVRDLRADPRSPRLSPALAAEEFVSYFAAPLITHDEVTGVLEVFQRSAFDPDREWLELLEALVGQSAIAIEQTSLFENLKRTNAELLQAYDSTIEGWSHALDMRDRETEGHTQRVTGLTLKLADRFGIKGDGLMHVRWGSLLHDIGKMGVPDSVLHKPGPLDPEEWEVMRKHPAHAEEALRDILFLRPALDIPYCHHERWDGTGYPRGLRGTAIPLAARIFAIVDVWDALTSDRPYRRAWSAAQALEHIRREAGQHFDPQVVEEFVKILPADGMIEDSSTTAGN